MSSERLAMNYRKPMMVYWGSPVVPVAAAEVLGIL